MANRSYDFEISWTWKEDGNRPDVLAEVTTVRSTTVQRAISKLARELTAEMAASGELEEGEKIKAGDLMIIDVRNHKLTTAILEFKKREQAAKAANANAS